MWKICTKRMQKIAQVFGIIGLFLPTTCLHAQLFDDFSDGNFTQNPTWEGSTNMFIVNAAQQLQLNAQSESVEWLTSTQNRLSNTQWTFWVKLGFSASANNQARVYLAADQDNLNGALNGYYLQLGEAGSNDAIELFKQTGTTSQSICRGTEGFITAAFELGIKITCSPQGQWQLFADVNGGNNYQFQASGNDNSFTTSQHFGVWCKFTASNASKFYFDDFSVSELQADLTPPAIQNLSASTSSTLDLLFTEPVQSAQATNPLNYNVTPGVGHPNSVVQDVQNPNKFTLSFLSSFSSGDTYNLLIDSISDLAGNTAVGLQQSFSWAQAQAYDVVINELMADPDPAVGLPNHEYLELFNHNESSITLSGWKLKAGTSLRAIPDCNIDAGGYLILCKPEAVSELSAYGQAIGVNSFSLTNTGMSLQLLDQQGQVISRVSYSDAWYQDPNKNDGGWALEQLDPTAVCLGMSNWKASQDVKGGTPGAINSVNTSVNVLPAIENIVITGEASLSLAFNQGMDSTALCNLAAYSVNQGLGNPLVVLAETNPTQTLTLEFATAFQAGKNYTLTLTTALPNCQGTNLEAGSSINFSIPSPATINDVIITEIMADPQPPEGLPSYEYLELFNRSNHSISLDGWSLWLGDSPKVITGTTINAGEYLIVAHQEAEPSLAPFGKFYGLSSFSITNSGMGIALRNASNQVISWVDYTDAWFGDSPKKNGGWAMELVDLQSPCMHDGNWQASVDASGGTPGLENSVQAQLADTTNPFMTHVSILSPEQIILHFSEPMDSTQLCQAENYMFTNGLQSPSMTWPGGYRNTQVILLLQQALIESTRYGVKVIQNSLTDCAGNFLSDTTTIWFGLPSVPSQASVIMNELLTNPTEGGCDYVELMNASEFIIDLADVALTYQSLTSSADPKTIFLPSFLLLPDQQYCLTKDPKVVTEQYLCPKPGNLIQIDEMPDFTSDSGIIILTYKPDDDIELDRLRYRISMHDPFLTNQDGVSLERINPKRPTQDATNWHSAAQSAGYGTPTGQNSQYAENPVASGSLNMTPEIFSPDNDGFDDITTLCLNVKEPGFTTNIFVFDAQGRPIRHLAKNMLLGTTNLLSWDGITDNGLRATLGIYIIVAELFNASGQKEVLKTTVVVASMLK